MALGNTNEKYLAGFIVAEAGDKNCVIGAVPARRRVNADITRIGSFIQTLATSKSTVCFAVNCIVVFVASLVAIDKHPAIGEREISPSGLGNNFGDPIFPTTFFETTS